MNEGILGTIPSFSKRDFKSGTLDWQRNIEIKKKLIKIAFCAPFEGKLSQRQGNCSVALFRFLTAGEAEGLY